MNKKEPILPPMDRRGGILDNTTIFPKDKVPLTLIFGCGLQKIAGPKQTNCRFNPPQKTQTKKLYNKTPRVRHNLDM